MPTTIKMPQLGESVTEGTIERWLVKEGDSVEQYDPLFEVVTDKVNAEVPSEVAGTITRIMVPDGETVAVGTPLAEIDAEGGAARPAEGQAEAPAEQEAPAEAPAEEAPQPAARREQQPASEPMAVGAAAASGPPTDASVRMTPAVRRLVREHEIDISQLNGSGAGGRVTRDDVLAYIERAEPGQARAAAPLSPSPEEPAPDTVQPAAASPAAGSAPRQEAPAAQPQAAAPYTPPSPTPAPTGGDQEVALSQMRKGIAAKMTRVKQTVPHAYTVVEVDMRNAVRWREANQAAYKAREGIGLSYVAVVVKAVTETLRQHPTVNSQFAEDKVILKQAMNIGIAVAVDNGLLVPVIHNADQLSISGVNHKVQDLAARARSNKLKLDEIQGGTFTVNNTGWFGSVSSMPIVNAPEVAILSMEAIVKRPMVVTVEDEDVIAIRPMMNMTCSFDHRVLDGAQVGAFLADVRKRLEEWDPDTSIG
jgi:2-oxoisovalerate dehydrogenase E2 component (dihydrolipoyl transacylase)